MSREKEEPPLRKSHPLQRAPLGQQATGRLENTEIHQTQVYSEGPTTNTCTHRRSYRESNKVIHGGEDSSVQSFMEWWHLSLEKGAAKMFLEGKGVNPDDVAPGTGRERGLERRAGQQGPGKEKWPPGWRLGGLRGGECGPPGPSHSGRQAPAQAEGRGLASAPRPVFKYDHQGARKGQSGPSA